jgi:hypothetical protein
MGCCTWWKIEEYMCGKYFGAGEEYWAQVPIRVNGADLYRVEDELLIRSHYNKMKASGRNVRIVKVVETVVP